MKLRALMLINDDHGYIWPGQIFQPGWRHEHRLEGQIPTTQWAHNPAEVERELVRKFMACYV